VGFITITGLLIWAYLLLERIYYRLAHKPNFAIAWLLPPGPVQVFSVLALPLLAMLVVLAFFYHYNIGRKLGAKLTIKVLPVKDSPPDAPITRYIVRTSLEDEHNKKAAENWVKTGLELELVKTLQGNECVNMVGHKSLDYSRVDGKDKDNSDPS